ncbi:MAG: ATP-dependent Clp protease adaptor ClpS, partial [Nitrospiria bacterium]
RLMLKVHHTGSAHVATLPREQAEFRQGQVHEAAKKEGFPFRCVIEPE